MESQHLDTADRVEVTIPLAQDLDIFGTRIVGEFYVQDGPGLLVPCAWEQMGVLYSSFLILDEPNIVLVFCDQ